jgi:hypothetical protein
VHTKFQQVTMQNFQQVAMQATCPRSLYLGAQPRQAARL